MPPKEDQKNLILAIVLSAVVLLGWHFLYAEPRMREERDRRAQQQAQQQAQQPGAAPGQQTAPPNGQKPAAPKASGDAPAPAVSHSGTGAVAPAAAGSTNLTRDEALKQAKRVPLEGAGVKGSISLKGARIDDVTLKRYHETVDPKSRNVVLLSPSGAPDPYYASFEWVQSAGSAVPMPDANSEWELESGTTLTPASPVTLKWDNGAGLVFHRTFSVDNDYLFKIEDKVENKTQAPVVLDYRSFISRHGTPKIEGFAFMHEGFLGVIGDKGLQEIGYAEMLKNLKEGEQASKTFEKSTAGWLGITDKYWATALIPNQKIGYDAYVTGFNKQGPRKEAFQVDYFLRNQAIAPGGAQQVTSHLFAGAKRFDVIERYESDLGIKRFDQMVDWGYFHFFTKPLFRLLRWLYGLLGNFGLAILAVTVLVKAAFFLPANWQYESMAKMKKLQPELERIKAAYKDDPQRMRQAQMDLMKKENVSTVYGCLPILLQMPVFFALYKVLYLAIEMRHAPFYGWIKDLSAPDPTTVFNLFGLLPFDPTTVPVIGSYLHVGVWPLIMGITMWIQFQMSPQTGDPNQQAIFKWMPLIFTIMMSGFAAGLIIYWAWSNLLTLIQQYVIMRKNGAEVHLWKNLGIERKSATG